MGLRVCGPFLQSFPHSADLSVVVSCATHPWCPIFIITPVRMLHHMYLYWLWLFSSHA